MFFKKSHWLTEMIEVLANLRSTVRQATGQNAVRRPLAPREKTTRTRSQSKKPTRKSRLNGSSLKLSEQALNSQVPTTHRDRKDRRSIMKNGNKSLVVQHLVAYLSASGIHPVSSI
ncbi:hypothetical protein CGRA01v4_14503 [Colletotrichum graminicola]|nr:hypothetical protein CGRA01v4_14503 [Colletotrichum graminicola]